MVELPRTRLRVRALTEVEDGLEEPGDRVGVLEAGDVGDIHIGANDDDGAVAGDPAQVEGIEEYLETVYVGMPAPDLM